MDEMLPLDGFSSVSKNSSRAASNPAVLKYIFDTRRSSSNIFREPKSPKHECDTSEELFSLEVLLINYLVSYIVLKKKS